MSPPISSQLILASKSTARAAMLRGAGLDFEIVSAGVDEDLLKAGLRGREAAPREVAHVLAEEKAKAGSLKHDGLVIGADSTAELEGALIDKAESLDEARGRLLEMRGRDHFIHSAVAVARAGDILFTHVDSARLTVRTFSEAFLDGYLQRNGGEILQSVGCYQLEGEGVQLFDRVEGDYFTVLGMPLLPLLEFLRRQDLLVA